MIQQSIRQPFMKLSRRSLDFSYSLVARTGAVVGRSTELGDRNEHPLP
ncbi:MAG: hypothetical protein ACFB8W_16750 [Elainellaceae cyanobacterium]